MDIVISPEPQETDNEMKRINLLGRSRINQLSPYIEESLPEESEEDEFSQSALQVSKTNSFKRISPCRSNNQTDSNSYRRSVKESPKQMSFKNTLDVEQAQLKQEISSLDKVLQVKQMNQQPPPDGSSSKSSVPETYRKKPSSRKWNGLRSQEDYLQNSPEKRKDKNKEEEAQNQKETCIEQLQEESQEESPQQLNLYERNMEWLHRKEEELAKKIIEKAELEMAECRFSPSTNKIRSRTTLNKRSSSLLSNSSAADSNTSLYLKQKEWQEGVRRKKEQMVIMQKAQIQRELRFQPKTNIPSKTQKDFGSFLVRCQNWTKEKKKKHSYDHHTFKPKINERSRKMEYPSRLSKSKEKNDKVLLIEEFQQAANSLAELFKESRELKNKSGILQRRNSTIKSEYIHPNYPTNRHSGMCRKSQTEKKSSQKLDFIHRALNRSRLTNEKGSFEERRMSIHSTADFSTQIHKQHMKRNSGPIIMSNDISTIEGSHESDASFEELVLSFGCNGPHRKDEVSPARSESKKYQSLLRSINRVNRQLEEVRQQNRAIEGDLEQLQSGCLDC